MEEEQIKIFADSLWDYMLEKKLKQYLSDSVCYYMATVVSPASNGTIVVQRPFDKPVTLPCGANAEGLNVGETCAVLVFGDFSNQIVIGDIANLQDKLTFDQTPTEGSQNPVTSGGVFDAEQGIRESIGITENGTSATHNITAGEYVVWQGSLYTASTNIAIGTVLSTSNLTAVADGGLNALSDAIDNTAVCKTLGTFSTLAALGTLLDAELPDMANSSVELIRVVAGASIYPFYNTYVYEGHIFKSGASTTYGSAILSPTGPGARPVWCKRSPGQGWEFELIATDADICNPNLLDNWYFVGGGSQLSAGIFPVNSRGLTSYSTANAFSIDRWILGAGTLTVNGDSISVSDNMWQNFASNRLLGKTVTLSALTKNNEIITLTANIPATDPNTWTVIAQKQYVIRIAFAGNHLIRFQLYSADYIAAKLELGDAQTLAHLENGTWVLNELPNYEEQLIRCKSSTADTSDTYANDPVAFVSDVSAVKGFGQAVEIASNTDLDTLIEPGAYYCPSSAVAASLINSPVTTKAFSLLVLARTPASNRPVQFIVSYDELFTRSINSGVWTPWTVYGDTSEFITGADVSNMNLLDNGHFVGGGSQQGGSQLPVNERGQTSYTNSATNAFTIDRWLASYGTLTVASDHINYTSQTSLAAYKRFIQLTGITIPSGTTVTISMLAKVNSIGGNTYLRLGNNYSSYTGYALTINATTTDYELFTHTVTTDREIAASFDLLVNNTAASTIDIDIKAAKIEIGDTQTLAHQVNGVWVLNEIPNYTDTLIRCKTSTAVANDSYANKTIQFN